MPKRSLTQLFVERIGPPKTGRVEYWDTHLPGFGLRISATGAKSWQVMLRVRGGKQVRETLGSVEAIPKVDVARERALASQKKARAGVSPVAARRAEECDTFAAAAGRFLAEHVERKCRPKTIRERKRLIESELIAQWGTRPIRDIARRDVTLLLDEKAKTVPKQADEVRKVLRTLFKWAIDKDLVDAAADPTQVSKRSEYEPRDRALSDEEVKLFWAGCDRLGWPFGPIFRLLLLTGQREGEVGGMRWIEVDLAARVWTIPGRRAKNGKAHVVHLSEVAFEIIDGLPRLTGDLLFASGEAAPSGYSKAKARLDGCMGETPHFVLHDLRRTAATGMARLGIAPHVVDKILNHTSGTIRGVAAIYNRFEYEKEREAALEKWGRYVIGLVRPGGAGNVVDLVAARA